MTADAAPLLEVEDLSVRAGAATDATPILTGVTFDVRGGEMVGLVGETGAGKSVTAWSLVRLLRPPLTITAGRVRFAGRDLHAASERELRRIRGAEIAYVTQNPRTSLDPMRTLGAQLTAVRRMHRRTTRADARAHALALLRQVGIPDAEGRYGDYPHQLSGGLAQRVAIAMALLNDPRLLVADEPTSSLDLTVQAQVLDLIRSTVDERGAAVLIITHDVGVVAQYCDRVGVMSDGQLVEFGPVREVLKKPQHPYTRRLLAAIPSARPTKVVP